MRDLQHIIAMVACLIGMFTDGLALIAGAIFLVLELIYFELKKLNDK